MRLSYTILKEKKLNLPVTTPPDQVERVDSLIDYYRNKERPLVLSAIDDNKKHRSLYAVRRSNIFRLFTAKDYVNAITRKSVIESLATLTQKLGESKKTIL